MKSLVLINENASEVLSNNISEFILGIEGRKDIEGVFLTPITERRNVTGFNLGIVYDGDRAEDIASADRIALVEAKAKTGFNFTVTPIYVGWFNGEYGNGDSVAFPVKQMLKKGSVFYDQYGHLTEFKEKVDSNDKITNDSKVVVSPVLKYSK